MSDTAALLPQDEDVGFVFVQTRSGTRLNKRFVNVTEYAGALIIYTTLFAVVGLGENPSSTQHDFHFAALLVMFDAHFAKRAFESAFLHKWSASSVSISDGLSEFAYYFGFAGWIGWSVHHDKSSPLRIGPSSGPQPAVFLLFAVLFCGAVSVNLLSHIFLRFHDRAQASARCPCVLSLKRSVLAAGLSRRLDVQLGFLPALLGRSAHLVLVRGMRAGRCDCSCAAQARALHAGAAGAAVRRCDARHSLHLRARAASQVSPRLR